MKAPRYWPRGPSTTSPAGEKTVPATTAPARVREGGGDRAAGDVEPDVAGIDESLRRAELRPHTQGHGLGNADAAVVETDEPRRARQVDRAHLVGTARELEQPAATDDDGAVRARHDGRRRRARRDGQIAAARRHRDGREQRRVDHGHRQLEASAQTRRAADGRAADHAGPEHAARDGLAEQPPHSHTTRHAHGRSDDRSLHARRSGQPHVTGRRAHRSGLHAHVRGEPHRVRAEDGVGVERGL